MNRFTSSCLVALVFAPIISVQAFAKGGNVRNEDYYDPAHLKRLPPEVLTAVVRECGTARALHRFAEYKNNLQTLVLHYEHFYCSTSDTYCGPSGCLHRVYGLSSGHYRLIKSYYAPEGNGE
jgi:hypothetical protein